MRVGIVALMVIPSAMASAEPPPFEASGFIGISYFATDIGLGDATAVEQRPQTAPAFGARLSFFPVRGTLSLGGELEASYSPSETATGADTPILEYRALVALRLFQGWAQPFVVGGIGAATITTSSPFVQRDTDAFLVWGGGLMFPMTDGWQLRADARQAWSDSNTDGKTATYEVLLGIGKRFGGARTAPPRLENEPVSINMVTTVTVGLVDTDGDGIPDDTDRCPNQVGPRNGCPEDDRDRDRDHDRIVGALDRCPDRAEDYDNFEDADGCPDEDNDADGIADANDRCPDEPETKNGIDDQDGCPDAMPTAMIEALDAASKVAFEAGRPRMTAASKPTLDKATRVLVANPKLRVTIILHPESTTDAAKELATKRAEVVKWQLVEQGVSAAQLSTTVGSVAGPKAPAVELLVTP